MTTPLPKGKIIGVITQLMFNEELDGEQGLMLRAKISNDPAVTDESVRKDAYAFLAPPHAKRLLEVLGLPTDKPA